VTDPPVFTYDLPPTAVEAWWWRHAPPERLSSARALYDLMSRQRSQLPLVDAPYDPRSESHWAEAARIHDYLAHAPAGGRVLDVGPGDGWPSLPMAYERPDLDVMGVDPSAARTATCRANAARLGLGNAAFVTGDAAALPFPDATFSLVTAASSLEEATEPERVFAELARVLRPGGALRASYQDWRLGVPGFETVLLWDGLLWDGRLPHGDSGVSHAAAECEDASAAGRRVLLYTYVRREQEPPTERRYTLLLPAAGEAAEAHRAALLLAAEGRRAYGETLLSQALGVPLLERLAPHALRSTVVDLRRWTTEWLAAALCAAGFAEARPTVHAGEVGRRFARDLLARGAIEPFVPLFAEATRALGALAGSQDGRGMITALRR